jgi:hypothetical protein
LRLLARLLLGRPVQTLFQEHVMSSTTTNIESLAWMAEVGVPPEDVQYLKSMTAYGGLRIESVRARVKEIQERAYERLLAVSMLPARTSALTQ